MPWFIIGCLIVCLAGFSAGVYLGVKELWLFCGCFGAGLASGFTEGVAWAKRMAAVCLAQKEK